MTKFKKGDRVVVYRKTRQWIRGMVSTKDKVLKEGITLSVKFNGYDKETTTCDNPFKDNGKLTIWTDCLRKAGKTIVIVSVK